MVKTKSVTSDELLEEYIEGRISSVEYTETRRRLFCKINLDNGYSIIKFIDVFYLNGAKVGGDLKPAAYAKSLREDMLLFDFHKKEKAHTQHLHAKSSKIR